MKFLSNLHTHTLYCDGANTPEEYIKKAIEKGFVSIGFSGHSYLDFGEGWYMGIEGTAEYIKEIKALKEKYAGVIEVYLGLETDYYSNLNKNSKKDLGLDYIIGSLHYVKNEETGEYFSVDESPKITKTGMSKCGGTKEYIKKYYDTLIKMVYEQEPDIIGHLDLVKKFNNGNRFFNEEDSWYREIITETLEKIRKTNSIIEVNTGGMSRGWTDSPYPSKLILEEILEKKIPVILNSDTHSVDTIDYYFLESEQILKKIGFKNLMILKNGKFQECSL